MMTARNCQSVRGIKLTANIYVSSCCERNVLLMGEITFVSYTSQSIEKSAQAIAMPIYKFNKHNSNMSVEKKFHLGTLFYIQNQEVNIEPL